LHFLLNGGRFSPYRVSINPLAPRVTAGAQLFGLFPRLQRSRVAPSSQGFDLTIDLIFEKSDRAFAQGDRTHAFDLVIGAGDKGIGVVLEHEIGVEFGFTDSNLPSRRLCSQDVGHVVLCSRAPNLYGAC
jgi:hypothetical protein